MLIRGHEWSHFFRRKFCYSDGVKVLWVQHNSCRHDHDKAYSPASPFRKKMYVFFEVSISSAEISTDYHQESRRNTTNYVLSMIFLAARFDHHLALKPQRNRMLCGIATYDPVFSHFFLLILSRWWFQIFFFHPYLGKWSNLTNIFQRGWFNHQLVV